MTVVAAMFAGYSAYNAQNEKDLTGFALANIEALANGEPYDNDDNLTWQVGDKTITTKTFKAEDPKWTWSTEFNLWFFKNKITTEWPSSYSDSTITVKIKCCRLMGDLTQCNYEEC